LNQDYFFGTMMETNLLPVPGPVGSDAYQAFLLGLLKMQKLPELVGYLYTYQVQLGFSALYLALPREENKHVHVEKPKPGGKLVMQPNGTLEERVFGGGKRVILEQADGTVGVGFPLYVKGKLSSAVMMIFSNHAPVASAIAWLGSCGEGLALAVEQTFRFEVLEKQVREKSMQLAVMNALTAEKDYKQMFLTITAAINNLVPCDFFTITAISAGAGFVLSGYNAIKQPEGFVLLNRDELLDLLQLDLQTYRESAGANLSLYTTPRIFNAPEYAKLGERLIISNRVNRFVGIREAMFVPIRLSNESFATLILCSRQENSFSPKDLRMLTELANQVTHQIERLLSFEQREVLENQLRRENTLLIEELNNDPTVKEIIGQSPGIARVLADVRKVAPTDSTVLIQGETGTGKELIARAIHNLSGRKKRPLIKVNCAALPAQLIESELFGHEKGAFTGASERRIGKFELAQGGTIFLDEIGEVPLELQSKLLRVLQEYEIERVGGKHTIQLDIRVIAATNRNLQQEALQGRFRMDLFYRLHTFPIGLPPLRERPGDIPVLAASFADKYARKMGKTIRGISPGMMQCLLQHNWPGNIRELEHVVEQAVIVATGSELEWTAGFAAPVFSNPAGLPPPPALPGDLEAIEQAFLESQRQYIVQVLRETGGRIRGRFGAAGRLGLNATTLEARMKKLGIKKDFF
jgi:transcriptional regulator with GAF, ATPase, and Fis domain